MRSILVLKLCCLGDLVFLTPLLTSLRARWPDARITLAASSWASALCDTLPMVDAILPSPDAFVSRSSLAILHLPPWILRIRALHPDLVISAHRHRMFGHLARMSGASMRAGFLPLPSLTNGVPFDPLEHEVDRYLRIATELGCPIVTREPRLQVPKTALHRIDQLLSSRMRASDQPLICLLPGGGENPGTKMTIKRWGEERFAALARALLSSTDATILLAGGPEDRPLCQSILSAVGAHPRLISVAGEFPIRDFTALAARCTVVVGGDTGPLHIAAAVGSTVLMLFGPSDPRLVAPRDPRHRILWTQPSCSPCYTPDTVQDPSRFQGPVFPCHTGTRECLNDLDVDTVLRAAQELLTHARKGSTLQEQ